MPTPTQQLIEIRLGRDLGAFVAERLRDGDGWRRIAADIRLRTDISVSHETLRGWFPEHRVATTEATA